MNGHARRLQLEKKMHSDPPPAGDARHAHDGVAAVAAEPAPAPRPPILEGLLDAHLRGESRWPLVSKILAAVEGGPRPRTRAEVVDAVRLPAVGHVITLLQKRGVLIEAQAGSRVVLRIWAG